MPTVFTKDPIHITNPVRSQTLSTGLSESKRTIISFNEKTPIYHQKRFGAFSLILRMVAARKPDRTHIAP